jgi:hypothetical protein
MNSLTIDQIVKTTGAPLRNVSVSWPLIVSALDEFEINTTSVQIVAAATVAVETGIFLPVTEKKANPDRQPELWKIQSAYWPSGYCGRGFIQLTWKSGYERYGKELGIPLVETPELAATSPVAARILALYFRENHIDTSANAGDWRMTRKLVNHGLVGWDKYIAIVNKLVP